MTGSVEGVILAAGYSERANAFKPELILVDKPVLNHCIDAMYDVCSRITVVCGFGMAKVIDLVSGFDKVQTVFNPIFESGMFSSVLAGLKQTNAEHVFLLPGDMPMVTPAVYHLLLEGLNANTDDVIIPEYQGTTGHPVLMSRRVVHEICCKNKSSNLKDELANYPLKTVSVNDPGVLMDLDTPEDYEIMKEQYAMREASHGA